MFEHLNLQVTGDWPILDISDHIKVSEPHCINWGLVGQKDGERFVLTVLSGGGGHLCAKILKAALSDNEFLKKHNLLSLRNKLGIGLTHEKIGEQKINLYDHVSAQGKEVLITAYNDGFNYVWASPVVNLDSIFFNIIGVMKIRPEQAYLADSNKFYFEAKSSNEWYRITEID